MNTRRSFLKKLSISLGLLGASMMPKQIFAKNKNIEDMLIHHVYFWLKNPNSAADRKKFEEGIGKLTQVKNIYQSHFGVPAGTENRDVVDHSYTYSLMVMFTSQADQDAYQIDPIHIQFVSDCADLWTKVVVYDSIDR